MTTDAPSDMIRMQNSNQAKRCSPFPVGAAILLPERRIPGRTLLLCVWHHRSTRKRRELEADTEQKDYKALCKDLLFLHPERYTIAKDTLSHIDHWRGLFIKTYGIAEQKHYKTMYEGLLYGDPKMRILRILWTTIYNDHNARIKEEQNHGKH